MKTNMLNVESLREDRGGLALLSFPRLADPKVLTHAVSTRLGGVGKGMHEGLNLSFKVGDHPARVRENRVLLSKALGMDILRAVHLDQVHGDKVLKLDPSNLPQEGGSLGEADGLITREVGVPILVMVADCLPVLFYDPSHGAMGIAHAGWRGTVFHVAAKTLLAMAEAYGTKPEEVKAVLGPCVGACCYEVGEDVKREFESVFPWGGEMFRKAPGRGWKLDLAEANARQLLEVGLKEENLIRSGLCTVEHLDLFFSHRVEASQGKNTGRMGVFMRLNG